jgi:hypothetical protein
MISLTGYLKCRGSNKDLGGEKSVVCFGWDG